MLQQYASFQLILGSFLYNAPYSKCTCTAAQYEIRQKTSPLMICQCAHSRFDRLSPRLGSTLWLHTLWCIQYMQYTKECGWCAHEVVKFRRQWQIIKYCHCGTHKLIPNPAQIGSTIAARESVKLLATGIFHAPILLPNSISLSYALLSKQDQ